MNIVIVIGIVLGLIVAVVCIKLYTTPCQCDNCKRERGDDDYDNIDW